MNCKPCQQSTIERFFGRQIVDSGTDARMSRAERDRAVYLPSNPLPYRAELGIVGVRYGYVDYVPVTPDYTPAGYHGVLPINEQPRLEIEQPFRQPVRF